MVAGGSQIKSVSDLLYSLSSNHERGLLRDVFASWEKRHGPVDLTKSYVTTWPLEQRKWLFENEPERFFKALPEFVQEYLRMKCQYLYEQGQLDDMEDQYVQLFMSGKMGPPGPQVMTASPQPHSPAP